MFRAYIMKLIPLLPASVTLALAWLACHNASWAQQQQLGWGAEEQIAITPAELPAPELKHRLLPPLSEQTPGNAAPIYLAAFPAGAQVEFKTVETYLVSPGNEFPAKEAAAYVARSSDALKLLEVAGRRSYCDWAIPLREEGLRMNLSYVRNGRLLGRLLALRIRLELRERRFDEALRSLQTGFALARSYSTGASFLPLMASTDSDGIEKALYDRIREWIQIPGSPNLFWALADLPHPFHDVRHALQLEGAALYFTFPTLRAPERLASDEARIIMEQIWKLVEGITDDDAKKAVAECIPRLVPLAHTTLNNDDQFGAKSNHLPDATLVLCHLVAEYRRETDRLFKWAGVPYWQAEPGLGKSFEKWAGAMSRNPLLKLVPRVPSQLRIIAIRDREAAMLRCVEGLRAWAAKSAGAFPASLEALGPDLPLPQDPLTGKPFEYQVKEGVATFKATSLRSGSPASERVYRISLNY